MTPLAKKKKPFCFFGKASTFGYTSLKVLILLKDVLEKIRL